MAKNHSQQIFAENSNNLFVMLLRMGGLMIIQAKSRPPAVRTTNCKF